MLPSSPAHALARVVFFGLLILVAEDAVFTEILNEALRIIFCIGI